MAGTINQARQRLPLSLFANVGGGRLKPTFVGWPPKACPDTKSADAPYSERGYRPPFTASIQCANIGRRATLVAVSVGLGGRQRPCRQPDIRVLRRLGGGSQTCADLNPFMGQIQPFGIPPMRRSTYLLLQNNVWSGTNNDVCGEVCGVGH